MVTAVELLFYEIQDDWRCSPLWCSSCVVREVHRLSLEVAEKWTVREWGWKQEVVTRVSMLSEQASVCQQVTVQSFKSVGCSGRTIVPGMKDGE